jgi:hypothetical protein
LERIVADLSAIEFSFAGDPPEKLTLNSVPVLRWSNPLRNVDDAAVFVLAGAERPEMIATVMSYRGPRGGLRRAYEFLSLSQERLEAIAKDARIWGPAAARGRVASHPRRAGAGGRFRRAAAAIARPGRHIPSRRRIR